MAEYRLSYTAAEIDEKLGKIDNLVVTVNGKTPDANGNVEIEVFGGNVDQVSVEPTEDDIPKVFFGGALQQAKTEAVVPFRYISKTSDFGGYAEIKAQGNSSMSYPKKNQTVKMFKDAACEEKLKVDFKGWGKQNKHCYKANWIDLTHARNVVSARLWADVVKSRANYAELPELLRTSPNMGAVDGFPVKVYAAGVYQGRYTLNIPKDKWAFNMDDELDEHCVLCGENYVSGCFRAAASINGSDWTDEIHDTVPVSIKTRWNQVISFVMNSTDEEFRANLNQYFYVDSLIDYYLFGLVSCGLDAFGKNQIYMTYDGQRWIASMYDMDSTWGLYYTGEQIVSTDYARTKYEDWKNAGGNMLYIRLEQLFSAELQTRWAELRNGALSITNIINRFERFTDIALAELIKEDYATTTGGGKFTGIPSKDTNNIQQIRSFSLARHAWVDAYVSALNGSGEQPDNPEPTDIPCTGIALDNSELTFNGSGTQTITATVTPTDTTDPIVWSSNNEFVATVENGVVTAVSNGDAVITADCGNQSASCSVSVNGFAFIAVAMTKGGTLDRTTGQVINNNENGYYSDYVPVEYIHKITVTCAGGWAVIHAYDAEYNNLGIVANNGETTPKPMTFTVTDEEIAYIRFSCVDTLDTNNCSYVTVEMYDVSAEYFFLTNGVTIKTDGTVVSGSVDSYALEEYFAVNSGETYIITCLNPWLSVCGYDSEKVFVSILNTETEKEKTATVTIPNGVSYIRWGCYGSDNGLTTIIKQ